MKVDYPADLVARLRRMREAHGYSRTDARYSGHELLAIRIPGSDVWQLPTAYQAQAWADGRITIGAQL